MTKNRDVFVSLLVMLLWGLLFPLVKMSYSVFGISDIGDVLMFAGSRFAVCGGVIVGVTYAKNKDRYMEAKSSIPSILLSGLFAIVLHYGFNYVGLMATDGSKTAIMKQVGTIVFIVFSGLFFKEDKLNTYKVIGLILGFCGIIAINFTEGSIRFWTGDILIIAASFCTVISNIISKKALTRVEPTVLTGISQFTGGCVLMLIGLCFGGRITNILPNTPGKGALFTVIVIASIVSYCLWFSSVQKENLSRLFIIKFAEPLFASFFGWLLLKEDILNKNYIIAFVLISVGITIANKKEKQ